MKRAESMRPAERQLAAYSGLFRGLAAAEADAILDQVALRTFERQEILYHQGEEVTGLFLLLGGRTKLSQLGIDGDEVILRFVGPAELFAGVGALERSVGFPVTAQALTPVRVAFWPRPAIRGIFGQHPSLSANLLQEITECAQEFQSRLREVATERVPQRVAHMLLRLAEQAGKPVNGGTLIDFPLTRQDLAEMTGTTLYTVSRLLSAWSERGLLEVGRGRVVVVSKEGLGEVADEA